MDDSADAIIRRLGEDPEDPIDPRTDPTEEYPDSEASPTRRDLVTPDDGGGESGDT